METRFLLRATQRITCPSIHTIKTRLLSSSSSSKPPPPIQAIPVGGYYSSILDSPSTYASASKPTITILPEPEPSNPPPSNPPKTREAFSTKSTTSKEEPAILFSPRTVTKWEDRRDALTTKYTAIAGVKVPSKPVEPDNCCMAGCVNCVWDLYGEELEVWSAAKKEADARLAMEGKGKDGGEKESGWGLEKEDAGEELLSGIDVGIREFMRVERMLKEKHGKGG